MVLKQKGAMIVGPDDVVHGGDGQPDGAMVLDFWRWAFSDLCDDDIKGWFAEWLVGLLLGLQLKRRVSWAESDHVTPEGVRIEVKASAYWQSWKVIEEDGTAKLIAAIPATQNLRISFSGLHRRSPIDASGALASPTYKSDIYVFAFQNEREPTRWSGLDLSQWEFYALTREQLTFIGTRSISLTKLRSLCAPMTASEFRVAGKAMVQEVAVARASAPAIAP